MVGRGGNARGAAPQGVCARAQRRVRRTPIPDTPALPAGPIPKGKAIMPATIKTLLALLRPRTLLRQGTTAITDPRLAADAGLACEPARNYLNPLVGAWLH